MALHSVCTSCVKYKFRNSYCSFTALSLTVISVFVIVIPFIIAFRAQGLWLKEDSYREQPDVHFKYEYFFMAETEDVETQVICTSFDSLSGMRSDVTNCPIIRVREEDVNLDGLNDILYFELEALLPGVENVQGVTLMLLFDYKLHTHSWLRMECLGLVREVSPLGGRSLEVTSELRLHQRTPLMSSGRDTRYNASVFKPSGRRRDNGHFDLPQILSDYSNRNVSARLENTYSSWRRGRAVGDTFLLKATVSYPEDTMLYTPGLWQVLKHAWVQYLALLVPFFIIGSKFKIFLLESRILASVKEFPWKKIS